MIYLIISFSLNKKKNSFMNPSLGNLDNVMFNAFHVVNDNEWNTFSINVLDELGQK